MRVKLKNKAKKVTAWYCKKLKGKHQYIQMGEESFDYLDTGKLQVITYLHCKGCRKQKTETKLVDKKKKSGNNS